MSTARVTISLPLHVLTEADTRAAALDRSRSWLIAEAVRRFLATPTDVVDHADPLLPDQFSGGVNVSAVDRVLAAERAVRRRGAPAAAQGKCDRVFMFDRYEDFLDWQRREESGG